MTNSPFDQACLHLATPEEQQRDRDYQACNAQPGDPCTWAKRYDGHLNPPFHSERLEAAATTAPHAPTQAPDLFRAQILETGLV